MGNSTLVIGASGTGKSTSIRTLDPSSTFIINVLDKALPFRGYRVNYKAISSWKDESGNYLSTDEWSRIITCINYINKTRPDIKTLVLDDWQYVMANEFMRRVSEKGFEKFSELGAHSWEIFNALGSTRDDLTCFTMAHNDIDQNGRSKCKTIGKLLDEKITIEGMFTVVLHTMVSDNQYKFLTQNDGLHIAKSPLGMFTDLLIDNDLQLVSDKIKQYYEG